MQQAAQGVAVGWGGPGRLFQLLHGVALPRLVWKEPATLQCRSISGSTWKTVMLVLCPLAFILGLVILALNIHYNK